MCSVVAYVFPGVGGSLIGSRVPKITTFDDVSPLRAIWAVITTSEVGSLTQRRDEVYVGSAAQTSGCRPKDENRAFR